MNNAQSLITPETVAAMWEQLDTLPLREGEARVCCLGCGESLVTQAGHEHTALVTLQHHALDHDQALSPEFRATTHDGLPTNDLIITFTYAMPAEEKAS